LSVVAICLVTANWYIALFGGAAFLLLAVRSRKEEAKLIERFGDDYREYARRTGAFLPKWSG
jgi:protein-S-isoprenylcysteine O-methyltransferase Ste14